MKIASLALIKKELHELPYDEVLRICLQLARYKKENKELLHYLLFESGNEAGYNSSVKEEVEQLFKEISTTNFYLIKKSIRRILRILKKYIKYSGKKETEVELLIFFCEQMQESGIRFRDHAVLLNIYQRQLNSIEKAVAGLHEDLQYDYQAQISSL